MLCSVPEANLERKQGDYARLVHKEKERKKRRKERKKDWNKRKKGAMQDCFTKNKTSLQPVTRPVEKVAFTWGLSKAGQIDRHTDRQTDRQID